MKKIDFEAHFLTEDYIDALRQNKGFPRYVENSETKSHDLNWNCYNRKNALWTRPKTCESSHIFCNKIKNHKE